MLIYSLRVIVKNALITTTYTQSHKKEREDIFDKSDAYFFCRVNGACLNCFTDVTEVISILFCIVFKSLLNILLHVNVIIILYRKHDFNCETLYYIHAIRNNYKHLVSRAIYFNRAFVRLPCTGF